VATRNETHVIYAAGCVQGIVLVTFPAASTVFTDPARYDLTSAQYGILFLPQVVAAIAASLLGAELGARLGTKRVYLSGLGANLLSMVLLIITAALTSEKGLAFVLLLLATGCLGTGFGLTVPALNTFTAAFHADSVDRSILVLNALLGLGTVLAPVFVAVFVGLGFWWGLPVTSVILLIALLLVSVRLPLKVQRPAAPATSAAPRAAPARSGIPTRFWVYAVFAVLYGVCETVNGNWSQLDMTRELGASTAVASLALTAFWGMVTVGRVLFASIARWFPARLTYHLLPFLLAGVFVIVASLPDHDAGLGVVAFGLAGLCCSALLPLTISFGQEELSAFAAGVAGGVIAFYQLGYGIAAFGIGPLVDDGVSLSTIYGACAAVAVCLGAWSVVVARSRPSPAALHPRLGHAVE
jgi:fucose permease